MVEFNFTIEGQNFLLPGNYPELEGFGVASLPRPYNVLWQAGTTAELVNNAMAENAGNLLVVDENILKLFSPALNFPASRVFSLPADEDHKSLWSAVALFDFLQERGFDKSKKLIVVGGGITQDVGAFAAGIYKRGLNWVFYPTTLLAMCDSCIGAKAGLNFKGAKNQLAIFSAPSQVLISQEFLKTLSPREFHSGLGEILKLHITGGRQLLDNYNKFVAKGAVKDFMFYKALIFGSLLVKKAVIERDEFERGLRRGLNYGHTFGHAIEALSNYAIPHGQGVAAGMVIVNQLAVERGLLDARTNDYLKDLCLDLLDLPSKQIIKSLSAEDFIALLKQDKKAEGSNINLVFLKDLGETVFIKQEINNDLTAAVNKILRDTF